jgi:hypothetical protein
MLAIYSPTIADPDGADLAVHAGAGIIFTAAASTIVAGNVCGHFGVTGNCGKDLEYKFDNTANGGCSPNPGRVFSGGCNTVQLGKSLVAAMSKDALPMVGMMRGDILNPIIPGTYRWSEITIADNDIVYLSGGAADIFLFLSGGAMTTGVGVTFTLRGGAKEENILFATAAAATTGAGSSLPGSILAGAAITLGADSEVGGYVLATAAMSFGAGCSVNTAKIVPKQQSPIRSPITDVIDAAECYVYDNADAGWQWKPRGDCTALTGKAVIVL